MIQWRLQYQKNCLALLSCCYWNLRGLRAVNVVLKIGILISSSIRKNCIVFVPMSSNHMVKKTTAAHGKDPTMPCNTMIWNVRTFITDLAAIHDSIQIVCGGRIPLLTNCDLPFAQDHTVMLISGILVIYIVLLEINVQGYGNAMYIHIIIYNHLEWQKKSIWQIKSSTKIKLFLLSSATYAFLTQFPIIYHVEKRQVKAFSKIRRNHTSYCPHHHQNGLELFSLDQQLKDTQEIQSTS